MSPADTRNASIPSRRQKLSRLYNLLFHLSLTLPLFIFLASVSFLLRPVLSRHVASHRCQQRARRATGSHWLWDVLPWGHSDAKTQPAVNPLRTILVTDVSSPAGLHIARTFYTAGHVVIGVDYNFSSSLNPRIWSWAAGSSALSKAVSRYELLQRPPRGLTASMERYVRDIMALIERHEISLWVSCADSPEAFHDDTVVSEIIRRCTPCQCFISDAKLVQTLQDPSALTALVQEMGIPAVITQQVTSRDAVHRLVQRQKGKQFILRAADRENGNGDEVLAISKTRRSAKPPVPRLPLSLPARTLSQTYQHVAEVEVSQEKPLLLQETVSGRRYRASAIVVFGEVKFFATSAVIDSRSREEKSSDVWPLPRRDILPDTSLLYSSMLNSTRDFFKRSPGNESLRRTAPNGHFTFTFIVQERTSERGVEQNILLESCTRGVDWSELTLGSGPSKKMEVAEALLSLCDDEDRDKAALNGFSTPEIEITYYDERPHQKVKFANSSAPITKSIVPVQSAPDSTPHVPVLCPTRPIVKTSIPITSFPYIFYTSILHPFFHIIFLQLSLSNYLMHTMLPFVQRLLDAEFVFLDSRGARIEAWDLSPAILDLGGFIWGLLREILGA